MDIDNLLKPVFMEGLQKIANWYKADSDYFLRSIFDLVGFRKIYENEAPYFVPPFSLSPKIAYPLRSDEEKLINARKEVLKEIEENHQGLSNAYLTDLSVNQLFFLMEIFGGCVPFDKSGRMSVFDTYRVRAARSVIRSNRDEFGHKDNLLINIDLSGIQSFIYTITATGALKNLRARSFFIELLSNHIVMKVLKAYNLHNCNLLMNGGGSVIILSGSEGLAADSEKTLQTISNGLNSWLLREFDGQLYAAFSYTQCSDEMLDNNLSDVLDNLSTKAFEAKQTKFKSLIDNGMLEFVAISDPRYPGCCSCSKDDAETRYQPVSEYEDREHCSFCKRLIELGSKIPQARFLYACDKDSGDCLKIEDTHYVLSANINDTSSCAFALYDGTAGFIRHIKDGVTPIFATTYTKKNNELIKEIHGEIQQERDRLSIIISSAGEVKTKKELQDDLDALNDENTATLEYMAKSSQGVKLLAALRMDADNIGKILHGGFRDGISLEGLSSFSRNLNYFFKLYLESICRYGIERTDKSAIFDMREGKGRHVHVIYAGGDDLFALGAWSDTACLSMDVGEAFKKYTCDNVDIGLSGGLTLHHDKFPVSKMAEASMAGLACAKKNFQPCWMCRDNWVECLLFDMGNCGRKDSVALFHTGQLAERKNRLDEQHRAVKYEEEAARLKLALKWRYVKTNSREIQNEVDDYVIQPLKAFRHKDMHISRGFFHNVLSLLNTWYDDGLLYLPRIVWILEKFKNELRKHMTNAEDGETLYDLYEMFLHLHDKTRFSTLYLPLFWNILLMKGEHKDEN